jgi:alkyldihydroxyacetonephosphate synthase
MTREMHWSRWGDPERAAPLPESARALVDAFLGTTDTPAVEPQDVRLSDPLGPTLVDELGGIVGAEHVHTDHTTRLRRTRGKSTPDLLRLRAGDGSDSPDAVVRPADAAEVAALLDWAVRRRVAVVPFGGGTSVVGGLVADRAGFAGVVSLDLVRFDRLVDVDRESMTAVLEPGLRGPEAEALLAAEGLTLGHFPQSFEYATIGGFAVTRSSGQSSAGYGRFDSLVVGLTMVTPIGVLELGSSLGVVTAVRVRVRPVPEEKVYEIWRFGSFDEGATAMRRLAQGGLLPTVLRLSDEAETAINLSRPDRVGGESAGGCVLVVGHEGEAGLVAVRRTAVAALLTELGGEPEGTEGGDGWAAGRFDGPYLRDALLDVGVLVETLETVTFWSRLQSVYDAVRAALTDALGEQTLVLCHISHVYETGASLYFTVATTQADDPVAHWRRAKAAASDAMLGAGASITHHHAVGRDHLPWLAEEIGPVGVEILRAVKARLDPTGILNPGILIP